VLRVDTDEVLPIVTITRRIGVQSKLGHPGCSSMHM